MSVKDEQNTNLEEEVVVNDVDTTELVELDKETRKAKVIKVAKKVGKVAGIAAVGVIGFLLGRNSAGKTVCNDSDEVIDVDYEDVTNEK